MKEILSIFLRYFLILLLGFSGLKLIYLIFSGPTIYLSYLLFSFFGESNLFGNVILFNKIAITLVEACIAGSAYYLLFILVFSIPKIDWKKRISLLIFVWFSFLFFNLVRIIIMGLIFGTAYFNQIHLFFWYFVSLLLVLFIWFSAIKIFRVKSIPVYSDFVYLIKLVGKKNA